MNYNTILLQAVKNMEEQNFTIDEMRDGIIENPYVIYSVGEWMLANESEMLQAVNDDQTQLIIRSKDVLNTMIERSEKQEADDRKDIEWDDVDCEDYEKNEGIPSLAYMLSLRRKDLIEIITDWHIKISPTDYDDKWMLALAMHNKLWERKQHSSNTQKLKKNDKITAINIQTDIPRNILIEAISEMDILIREKQYEKCDMHINVYFKNDRWIMDLCAFVDWTVFAEVRRNELGQKRKNNYD